MAVAQVWRRILAQALVEDGLSDATALPLLCLYRNGDGVRQRVLAEAIGVDNTSVVRVLDHLERDGLVRREMDPSDRRAKLIVLTDAGTVMARRAVSVSDDLRARVLTGVSDDDFGTVSRVLGQISQNLQICLNSRASDE